MAQFESRKEEVERLNISLVFIAAEKRGGFFKPERYLERHAISFPFLLDEDRSVTKAYGLYHRLGRDAFNIAHPATLVVGLDGILRFIYRGENQTDRAPLEAVFSAVERAR